MVVGDWGLVLDFTNPYPLTPINYYLNRIKECALCSIEHDNP